MVMPERPGHTLVEATVALVLLAAGVIAVAGSGASAARGVRRSIDAEAALAAAASVLDSVLQHGRPADGVRTEGRHLVEWTVSDSAGVSAVLLRVRYASAGTVREDTFAAATAAWPARVRHVR